MKFLKLLLALIITWVPLTTTAQNITALTQKAQAGDAKAQGLLAFHYWQGYKDRSNSKALTWAQKSAAKDNPFGLLILGCLYNNGDGVTQNKDKANDIFKKSSVMLQELANQGDADAQFFFGWCYYFGCGLPYDLSKAIEWYTKAAEQGNANAQTRLGFCYEEGEGVPKSYTEAVKWFRKAAGQGDAYAQCFLGSCYYYGEAVGKSYTQAAKWYRKAAVQGYAVAQCYLGELYRDGEGVQKSRVQAKKWLKLAAAQGNEQAIKDLEPKEREVTCSKCRGKGSFVRACKYCRGVGMIRYYHKMSRSYQWRGCDMCGGAAETVTTCSKCSGYGSYTVVEEL